MLVYVFSHLMACSSMNLIDKEDIVSRVTEAVTIMEYEENGNCYIRDDNKWFQVFLYGTGYYANKNCLKSFFPEFYFNGNLTPNASKIIKFWDELSNSRDKFQTIFSSKKASHWSASFQSDGDFLKELMVPGKFKAQKQFSALIQNMSQMEKETFFPGLNFKEEKKIKNDETKLEEINRFTENCEMTSFKLSRYVNASLGYCQFNAQYNVPFQKQILTSVFNAEDSIENLMSLPWKNDPKKNYFSAHIGSGMDYFIDKKPFNLPLKQDILLYIASVSSEKQKELDEKFSVEPRDTDLSLSETQNHQLLIEQAISDLEDLQTHQILERFFEVQHLEERINLQLQTSPFLQQPPIQVYQPLQIYHPPAQTLIQQIQEPLTQEYPMQEHQQQPIQLPVVSQQIVESYSQESSSARENSQANLLNFNQNNQNNVMIIRGKKWRCKIMPNGTFKKLHPIK